MLIGLLTSTIQAPLPASFNCSFLQMQQIPSLMENLVLNENPKIKLKWWTQNLELCDMRALTEPPAEVLIQTDVRNKDWG